MLRSPLPPLVTIWLHPFQGDLELESGKLAPFTGSRKGDNGTFPCRALGMAEIERMPS